MIERNLTGGRKIGKVPRLMNSHWSAINTGGKWNRFRSQRYHIDFPRNPTGYGIALHWPWRIEKRAIERKLCLPHTV